MNDWNWKALQMTGPYGLWGDAALYLGMFAATGSKSAWLELVACLDKDGRLWRNSDEAFQGCSPYGHGTSRDMLAGFILGCHGPFAGSLATLQTCTAYLCRHNGKLSPTGDGRTQLRPGSWADLGDALEYLGSKSVRKDLGFKGWLYWKLLRRFKKLENLLSALTAWSDYQLHLVLVSMLTIRKQGKEGGWLWDKTLKVIDQRLPQNAIVRFLQGNTKWLKAELPHMWNRAAQSKEPYVWPWAFGSHPIAAYHMPAIAVHYMEALLNERKR